MHDATTQLTLHIVVHPSPPSRFRLSHSLAGLVVVCLAGVSACGSNPGTAIDGRLWVSGVPTSPKDSIHALVLRKGGDPYGILFRGTAYRGTHNVVRWHAASSDRGTMTMLADNTSYSLRIETCKPSMGFDHCIVLRGGPAGTERFQSRKRWAIGKQASPHETLELLADDLFGETVAADENSAARE